MTLFRSSRPFNRDGARIAERGPITPLPFAGALKTTVLLQHHPSLPPDWYKREEYSKIKQEVGIFGERSKMKILGAFLAKNGSKRTELFPLPMDFAKLDENRLAILRPLLDQLLEYDGMYGLVNKDSFYSKPVDRGFIERESLIAYLQSLEPPREWISKEEYVYGYERRFGITLKEGKVTEEGMLYTADVLRMREGYGFIAWLNEAWDISSSGYVRLGGEGKVASYEAVPDLELNWENGIRSINEEGRFKLYLATPSVFKRTSTDHWWRPNLDGLGRMLQVKIKCVGASLGKPLYVGGWDLARDMEKPLTKAVREGAVYFFQITEGKIDSGIKMPLQISDLEPDSGMGCALLGRW